MSHLTDSRFKSSNLILTLHNTFSNAEKLQPNAIFELEVTNSDKEKVTWTLDFKKSGSIYKGEAQSKPDVTIILSDDTLMDLADGKITGQKAYMTGKLKTRGNMMLATKLDGILKGTKAKL